MKLELYHMMHCPYSVKVRDFIENNGLKERIEYRDIDAVQEYHDQLVEINGHAQVPCLVIDGSPMLESDDIVAWLEQKVLKTDAA